MNTRRFRVLFFVACLLPVDVAVGIFLWELRLLPSS